MGVCCNELFLLLLLCVISFLLFYFFVTSSPRTSLICDDLGAAVSPDIASFSFIWRAAEDQCVLWGTSNCAPWETKGTSNYVCTFPVDARTCKSAHREHPLPSHQFSQKLANCAPETCSSCTQFSHEKCCIGTEDDCCWCALYADSFLTKVTFLHYLFCPAPSNAFWPILYHPSPHTPPAQGPSEPNSSPRCTLTSNGVFLTPLHLHALSLTTGDSSKARKVLRLHLILTSPFCCDHE